MKRDLLNEFDNWKTEAKERGEWPPRCSCGARPKWDELDPTQALPGRHGVRQGPRGELGGRRRARDQPHSRPQQAVVSGGVNKNKADGYYRMKGGDEETGTGSKTSRGKPRASRSPRKMESRRAPDCQTPREIGEVKRWPGSGEKPDTHAARKPQIG